MKLLLFDIDMTLVSTGGAGIRALDRAFETTLGLSHALDGVRPHGKTDPAIIREACVKLGVSLSAQTHEGILGHYIEYLKEEVADSENYRVLPGVVNLLDACRLNPDVVIGLATGNVESGARIKLERGRLNEYFAFGGFGSDSEDRSEVVRAAARRAEVWVGREGMSDETWVIGDTPMDIAAGREAGFRTLAVATGSYTPDQLSGADCVLHDLDSGRSHFLRSTRIV